MRGGAALLQGALTAALLAGHAPVLADGAGAEAFELRAGRQLLRIDLVSGLPSAWTACDRPCEQDGAARVALFAPSDGGMRWEADDPEAAAALGRVRYGVEVEESPEQVSVILTAHDPGRPLVQRYVVSRMDHGLRVQLMAGPGVRVALTNGRTLVPAQLPGLGGYLTDVEPVLVTAGGQDDAASGSAKEQALEVGPDSWLGIRARFWAWLARPAAPAAARIAAAGAGQQPRVSWVMPADGRLDLAFYAGPVEWKSLRVVSAELTQMLFAPLWEPLRWLCYGLLVLLGLITRVVGSVGLSIILLSLAVKLLLWPLTRIADRWQQDVNRAQARLQPRIADIRRRYRGEEAHNRVLGAYRAEGIHPLFTFKSLAGFALQVPVFIAAFDMLADNFVLSGAPFLWIGDLSAPDRLLPLPAAVPFFGAHLNLLPILMTLLTVLSAMMQRDPSLTPELRRRQQRQLYVMAGGFFLLFYTFPAGMVLYWTANNLWHLCKIALAGLVRA